MAESVSMALLVVLETLSPLERAVFVLKEVFGFSHAEIAEAVERSEAAVRQAAHRAREHVQARRPRFTADRSRQREVTERFFAAATGGDINALMELLSPDVTLWTDGGGKVRQALRPVVGARHRGRLVRRRRHRHLPGRRTRRHERRTHRDQRRARAGVQRSGPRDRHGHLRFRHRRPHHRHPQRRQPRTSSGPSPMAPHTTSGRDEPSGNRLGNCSSSPPQRPAGWGCWDCGASRRRRRRRPRRGSPPSSRLPPVAVRRSSRGRRPPARRARSVASTRPG